ncbi:hypothetical protein C2869_11120 [Saccharobesus litoralis]|uniref:LPP20 lipoprotein n=1 Tax=Saccharobesus litoralis TaxID=2172099 RepID=A0A2S0VRY0_9ALTE|nr:LPP20 family lipoprotein [Saccharobesus litoralis]AWB66953.1 hypothetical protein C2869_11120 [Saccharobesus litoralis]
MKLQNLLIATAVAGLLTACGSTEQVSSKPSVNIPQWVLNPVVENGIAAADCIKFSGNVSVDQKMARANARLALAQQIETKVEGLDKTYARRTDATDETSIGTNFSSVSKQITNQKLVGARVEKADIVNIAGKDHFCALMVLSPNTTKELFDSIVKESGRKVNPQDEKFLYEEFKAFKAEQDLDKEIARLTD